MVENLKKDRRKANWLKKWNSSDRRIICVYFKITEEICAYSYGLGTDVISVQDVYLNFGLQSFLKLSLLWSSGRRTSLG